MSTTKVLPALPFEVFAFMLDYLTFSDQQQLSMVSRDINAMSTRFIELKECSFDIKKEQFEIDGLAYLLRSAKYLRHIFLDYRHEVIHSTMENKLNTIFRGRLTNLRENLHTLVLRGCAQLPLNTLNMLGTYCYNIRTLGGYLLSSYTNYVNTL